MSSKWEGQLAKIKKSDSFPLQHLAKIKKPAQ